MASHSAEIPTSSPKSLKPTVTIVICTRNRPADLHKCLEGIARLQHAPDEVIVVDNTDGDKETESAAREFSARYLIEPTTGLSRARNRGLAESNSTIVAYLDDDAVPHERWLEFLLAPFADPHVAVVTGETIFPEPLVGVAEQAPARSLDNTNRQWFEIAAFGGFLGFGTNMALRKAACEGLKPFDVRLGRGAPLHGMEEHYAYVRLLSLNYCAVHVGSALVIHRYVRRATLEEEVSQSIAYWLMLFADFPDHRRDLLSFFYRRLRRKPLPWRRDAPESGNVVSSGWGVRLKAAVTGTLLYLRACKHKDG